ncbi:hypothetical protein BAY61_01715 [Prauserella marina]|nr:hypothetical protein BAY61_01715 [Prauserella marina]
MAVCAAVATSHSVPPGRTAATAAAMAASDSAAAFATCASSARDFTAIAPASSGVAPVHARPRSRCLIPVYTAGGKYIAASSMAMSAPTPVESASTAATSSSARAPSATPTCTQFGTWARTVGRSIILVISAGSPRSGTTSIVNAKYPR